jgi:hypothetical protein
MLLYGDIRSPYARFSRRNESRFAMDTPDQGPVLGGDGSSGYLGANTDRAGSRV